MRRGSSKNHWIRDKKMATIDEISSLHKSGFNCAQVVACLSAGLSGADITNAKAAMGGFGGGLRSGEVCGAVSGAIFSLGLCFPYTDGSDTEAKDKIARLTKQLTGAFRERYGSLTCAELLKTHGRPMCEMFMEYALQLVYDLAREERRE